MQLCFFKIVQKNQIPVLAAGKAWTHLLFLSVDQLFVIPVLQFTGSLGGWHGGVEDEELSATFCCLEGRE